MKKVFTLALALAAVASASAFDRVAAYGRVKMERPAAHVELKAAPSMDLLKAIPQRMTLADAILKRDVKAAAASRATTDPLVPLYPWPACTFFPYSVWTTVSGEVYDIPNGVLVNQALQAAYAPVVWKSRSYTISTASGSPRPNFTLDAATKYYWELEDLKGNLLATGNEANFTHTYNGIMVKSGDRLKTPLLTVGREDYQKGLTIQGEFKSFTMEFGGKGTLNPSWIEDMKAYGPDLVEEEIASIEPGMSLNYNIFDDTFAGRSIAGITGYDTDPENPAESWYAYDEELPLGTFAIDGLCQLFQKPAAPYALSSVTIPVMVTCKAGAKVKVSFYGFDKTGNPDFTAPINEYEHTFLTDAEWKSQMIQVPFTSLDAAGDELSYTLIDKAMIMIISGFEDANLDQFYVPLVAYDYDKTFETFDAEPTLVHARVKIGEGADATTEFVQSPYVLVDRQTNALSAAKSMALVLDVEYPFIMPDRNFATKSFFNPGDEYHKVPLTAEMPEALLRVICPGTLDDILIETEDGTDLPAWIEWKVISGPDLDSEVEDTPGTGVDEGQNYFYFYAGVSDADAAKMQNCKVVMTYKGQKAKFLFSTDPAGINNVVAGKDELDWSKPVYNVMGQRVSADFKGVAIQNGAKYIVK